MKKLILIIPLLFILSGCGTSSITPYTSEVSGEKVSDCSSFEPENPYSSGSGHYAGWEWAQDKEPSRCGGNSNSFIEGCDTYMEQLSDYENCLNQ